MRTLMGRGRARPTLEAVASLPVSTRNGLGEARHDACGLPVWRARLDEESTRRARWTKPYVNLAPWRVRHGGVRLDPSTMTATLVEHGDGWYTLHRCPARVTSCRRCGAPVRLLVQPRRSGDLHTVVVDAHPAPDGAVVVTADGRAVVDGRRELPGPRYWRHDCPAPPLRWARRGAERRPA